MVNLKQEADEQMAECQLSKQYGEFRHHRQLNN